MLKKNFKENRDTCHMDIVSPGKQNAGLSAGKKRK